MRKPILTIAAMGILVVLGSALLIYGQKREFDGGRAGGPPPPRGMERPMGFPPEVMEKLDLTADQKAAIESIRANERQSNSENFTTVRNADEQIRAMIDGGTFSIDAARPIVKARASAQAEIDLVRLANEAAIRSMRSRRKARLKLVASVRLKDGREAARLEGRFVALGAVG